jgi:hypothetical protein
LFFAADAYGFAYTRGEAASRSHSHLTAFGRYAHPPLPIEDNGEEEKYGRLRPSLPRRDHDDDR